MIGRSRFRLMAIPALATLVMLGVACGDDGDTAVPPPIGASEEATPTPPADQGREDFIEDARAKLHDLQTRIDELETKARDQTGDERAELEEQVESLRGRVDDIEQKLRDIELGDNRNFEDLRSDVEAALDDAGSRLNDIADALGI